MKKKLVFVSTLTTSISIVAFADSCPDAASLTANILPPIASSPKTVVFKTPKGEEGHSISEELVNKIEQGNWTATFVGASISFSGFLGTSDYSPDCIYVINQIKPVQSWVDTGENSIRIQMDDPTPFLPKKYWLGSDWKLPPHKAFNNYRICGFEYFQPTSATSQCKFYFIF